VPRAIPATGSSSRCSAWSWHSATARPDRFPSDLGALEGIDFAPLDFTAFRHIEQLEAAGALWGLGHAVHVVQACGPQAHDRYDSVIVTTDTQAYAGLPDIVAIDLAGL
jgi:hypothetical protein